MITIIARMTAKDGEFEQLRNLALELSAAVAANEPGNALYAISEGPEPNTLIFIERYAGEEAIAAHRASDHLKNLGRQLGRTLAGPYEILFRLTDLPPSGR